MNDFWKEGVMIRWAPIGPPMAGHAAHLNTTITPIFILEQAVLARIAGE